MNLALTALAAADAPTTWPDVALWAVIGAAVVGGLWAVNR